MASLTGKSDWRCLWPNRAHTNWCSRHSSSRVCLWRSLKRCDSTEHCSILTSISIRSPEPLGYRPYCTIIRRCTLSSFVVGVFLCLSPLHQVCLTSPRYAISAWCALCWMPQGRKKKCCSSTHLGGTGACVLLPTAGTILLGIVAKLLLMLWQPTQLWLM